MLLVWRMRQDIEFQKTRAIVQAVIAAASENSDKSDKQLQDTWQDLLDDMYPFQRGQRKRADQSAMDVLKREVARGPLRVKPLQPVGRVQSKMKTQYLRRQQEGSK